MLLKPVGLESHIIIKVIEALVIFLSKMKMRQIIVFFVRVGAHRKLRYSVQEVEGDKEIHVVDDMLLTACMICTVVNNMPVIFHGKHRVDCGRFRHNQVVVEEGNDRAAVGVDHTSRCTIPWSSTTELWTERILRSHFSAGDTLNTTAVHGSVVEPDNHDMIALGGVACTSLTDEGFLVNVEHDDL